jgi:hypothetical protein
MTKITKVVCTFVATEFDADLNVVSEKPVAIGRNEVEAVLFHPFDAPLRELVNELNARLEDAQEAATPPRAPSGGEAGLPGENQRYNGRPQTIKNRDARNAARAAMEKKVGNLPTKMEVDHIKPLIKKGTNKASNLKVVTRFQNRSKGDRTK